MIELTAEEQRAAKLEAFASAISDGVHVALSPKKEVILEGDEKRLETDEEQQARLTAMDGAARRRVFLFEQERHADCEHVYSDCVHPGCVDYHPLLISLGRSPTEWVARMCLCAGCHCKVGCGLDYTFKFPVAEEGEMGLVQLDQAAATARARLLAIDQIKTIWPEVQAEGVVL